ncbi:MAG TPA: anthranilate synthase component I family protein [Hanamia sp.]|nr:anthranilate synthase component I family protein [Hanamia sp.]
MLEFAKKFSNFCFLDNHDYEFDKSYDCIAACGNIQSIISDEKNGLESLDKFLKQNNDWIFGHVSYDLKNQIENLSSNNKDGIGFPDFYFFVPQVVFILSKETVKIGAGENIDTAEIFEQIISIIPNKKMFVQAVLESRFSKQEYLQTIEYLQQHILRGDCYEICFCQEYFAENVQIDPVNVFKTLCQISPNPFAAFYKLDEKYLLCASPERYLKKTGDVIISQPIKGTSKRTDENAESEIEKLHTDEKERAENVMIVDLVRNDLSKICDEGSVLVKEFQKIYSFPQVHQMISTISGKLREGISFGEILSATFPMGSMTGAPKKRVMELIEKYEKTKRGLFSGTVGYISPAGDFDFNVVIRSILYNEKNGYISIQAGSAITWKSIAEKEYEECKVKMEAMVNSLI